MAALRRSVCALTCVLFVAPFAANAEESRRIEEIVVTAEKRQSTVSDTSISITAFGEDMIKDFGIQGADELVNFIPATTRDAYDIRIRGVGRNFRALGGDPGVATYYNGVYSEDFGIAASENGLYDVQRIEALRGPQGTLYGRNSIGGALNYITNKPTQEFEGELRTLYGSEGAREYYGILSGPIIEDKLAVRVVGVKRERDGSTEGLRG
ncbi:MAG: iron complex outermembrane receptor protein, partial [Limisphaerales bacterium]